MAGKVKVTVSVEAKKALKDGYRAMANEDRSTAERSLRAGWEALKSTLDVE